MGDWRVAAYEVVAGETVERWTAADCAEVVRLAERMRDRAAAEGELQLPPLPVAVPVRQLAELESRWLDVLSPGSALHHGGPRRAPAGRAGLAGLREWQLEQTRH